VQPLPLRLILAREIVTRQDVAITEDRDQTLARPQRRLLRWIYNGRIVPIIVDDRPFLTYKEASCYLLALTAEAREKAYLDMKCAAAAHDATGRA